MNPFPGKFQSMCVSDIIQTSGNKKCKLHSTLDVSLSRTAIGYRTAGETDAENNYNRWAFLEHAEFNKMKQQRKRRPGAEQMKPIAYLYR